MITLLTWPFRLIGALGWYTFEFIKANLLVTREIVTPGHQTSPVVVRYPTRCRTELEISLFNLLVCLTPGTMPLATEQHPPVQATVDGSGGSENDGLWDIYVHSMFDKDPDHVREELRRIEDHTLIALRPTDRPHTENVTW